MNTDEIAVLVPCYNEALTIEQVVRDFKTYLPDAKIYVYDNNSQDQTKEIAAAAGAIVRSETLQGKGNVVKRMFADVEADIYVMVDGDATYDASAAPKLISHLIDNQLEVVHAARVTQEQEAYRTGHRLGNKLLTGVVAKIFGSRVQDMLSGYRVFSRRFVKSIPILSAGFEIETELTVHTLELKLPTAELPTPYFSRPEGSNSKLSTYKDGWKILKMIFKLVKREKPMLFCGIMALFFFVFSLICGIPVIVDYLETGLVMRFPSAFLAASLMVLALLSLMSGLILDTVTLGRKEAKLLAYLQIIKKNTDQKK